LADDFLGQLIAPEPVVVLTLTLDRTMPRGISDGKHHSAVSAVNMAARQQPIG